MAPAGGKCPHCHTAKHTPGKDRYYTTKGWQYLRRRQLALYPRCQQETGGVRCPQPATDVDHIVPRKEGGADALENLQSLCHSHHSAKTNRQNPHTRQRKPRSRLGQLRRAQGLPEAREEEPGRSYGGTEAP